MHSDSSSAIGRAAPKRSVCLIDVWVFDGAAGRPFVEKTKIIAAGWGVPFFFWRISYLLFPPCFRVLVRVCGGFVMFSGVNAHSGE